MHITLIIKEKVNLKSGRSKKGLFKAKKTMEIEVKNEQIINADGKVQYILSRTLSF